MNRPSKPWRSRPGFRYISPNASRRRSNRKDPELRRGVRCGSGFRTDCSAIFPRYFPLGTLNLHGSLLPRVQGAAPIQRAILAGEGVTGISIMLLDAGMDTGRCFRKKRLRSVPQDTFGRFTKVLPREGAKLLVNTLRDWTAGRLAARNQDEALATLRPSDSERGASD